MGYSKLSIGKSIRGDIFDNWHTNFYAKMSSTNIDISMKKSFTPPISTALDYMDYKR